jgi:hypothetical protein
MTECERVPELAEKKASPEYAAVSVTAPTVESVSEQLPVDRVAVQDAPWPSVTVTVPVGVPAAGATGETAKVTVTAWPAPEGAGESPVIAVVVLPRIVRPALAPLAA